MYNFNDRCTTRINREGNVAPYSEGDHFKLVEDTIARMAKEGLRTIGVAYRDVMPKEEIDKVCFILLARQIMIFQIRVII